MEAISPTRSRAGPEVTLHLHAHLLGDDVRQGGLPEAGRTVEQGVLDRLPPLPGGFQEDAQVFLQRLLADELRQPFRPEGDVQGLFPVLGLWLEQGFRVAFLEDWLKHIALILSQFFHKIQPKKRRPAGGGAVVKCADFIGVVLVR